jgi:hypothetical protein
MREDLINSLMDLRRKRWVKKDFIEAYSDEWDEIPEDLSECFEMMEEYISDTYDDELIEECIQDEDY